MTTNPTIADELTSIRDWLRYALSTFTRANLVYGHGTDNALDEAAFLIAVALELPIDDIGPWLDARLTREERVRLHEIIDARVATRKPAAYLVNKAFIKGHAFFVDERVIVPRSYLGELLCDGVISGLLPDAGGTARILELCTGSGCLAILAALEFPQARIVAGDISADALDVAKINVAAYDALSCIDLVRSDLFGAIVPEPYDLIIANPPYVRTDSVAAFPPEYRAEPELAHLGGSDGLDLVRRILADAPRYLARDGLVVVEIGDTRAALEAAYPDMPFLWLDTETSSAEVFALTAANLRAPGRKGASKEGPAALSRIRKPAKRR